MRKARMSRRMLAGIGLAATLGMAGCTAHPAANSARPGSSQTARPSGIQNLVISSAVRSDLGAAYAAAYATYFKVPVSALGRPAAMPGEAYYAYDPSTDTYWALATIEPTSPPRAKATYMDGTEEGMFKEVGAGRWQVLIGGMPLICDMLRFFPKPVLRAWHQPTALPAGITC